MPQLEIKRRVVDDDRVLLYGSDPNYHLIAKLTDKVKVGQVVEYEECGVNFGWFKKVIS